MAFLPLDRLPPGQHSTHLWREHMHQMARVGSTPTVAELMPSVTLGPSTQTPLTIIATNNTGSTIEAGMSAFPWVKGTQDPGRVQLGGVTSGNFLKGHAITAVADVPDDAEGEFYCAGIYPARFTPDATLTYPLGLWCDQASPGALKQSYLGDFFSHYDSWEDSEGNDWTYVSPRYHSLGVHQQFSSPFGVAWTGPVFLTSGSVGGTYEWDAADNTNDNWETISGPHFNSTNLAPARNMAEVDTTGHVNSVPSASIPSGWGAVRIQGVVVMYVSFHQGSYTAWFFAQNPILGDCPE